MFELLESLNHWHWLALGLVLLGAELLGTAGYFLWIGLSALLVGALLSIIPMSWQLQWISFAVFSLVATWLWWRRQFKSDRRSDNNRDLNDKHKQLIGQTLIADKDLEPGKNRMQLGDTTWTAQVDTPIKAGDKVVITDVQGIILTVSKQE
ncbi:NfeD family protein [Vibrio paucivorans]|uniref:NfeD family protein n=1 Tax=Vibrio paucivorans TaxID=2829489 RepID=A0A9X3CBJ0_9VIBR|nr:NfeD family protein [Vibrio paucivorans]MCW8332662.1 NfeD family protein [Vibrio paucivorans]